MLKKLKRSLKMNEMLKIYRMASQLAEELASDIAQCKTREEHIRVTARANAASELVADLVKVLNETSK